jgi:stalled ribosome alternative rescue factor ArfA
MRAAVSLWLLAVVVSFLFCFQGHPIQASAVVSPDYGGVLDGANCGDIGGWAWDANDPNNSITVDIYSDNVLVATVVADIFRQDLLDANKGNGAHGFDIATPDTLKDGQSHSIRVTIGGTNINLNNSPKTINCPAGTDFGGFHDAADCNRISGWAWDAKQPNTPINVDVYIDNDNFRSIEAPADKFRQDLLNAGKGNGVHGFVFSTPSFLKDGHPHSIRVTFSDTLVNLSNTPKSINCPGGNPPPDFGGFHDGADCNQISGWAWDANTPNTPISVDIYSDNMLIATIAADLFRQDLVNAGIGDGRHGFILSTPMSLKDNQTHTISIGFHNTDIPLGTTNKTIHCP